jgi:4-amino-4-deoxy-L-arabinose transferase-like glycosyltransferase
MEKTARFISSARAALLLAALVCAFYLTTTRKGLPWMDDYAQYITHAANIAGGRPYAATGYIFNPAYPYTGPAAYPPVFPLALAPAYKLFGLDLRVMKAVSIVAFSAFVFTVFLLFRRGLGGRAALAAAALIGFNPAFWDFKDNVYPDFLFLFFAYAALLLFEKAAEKDRNAWNPAAALPLGLALYLAYGTRTVGVLLAAAFFIADLARGRGRPSKTLLCAGGLALAGAILQGALIHGGPAYIPEALAWIKGLSLPRLLLANATTYPALLASLFDNAYFRPAGLALACAAGLLAAAGFWERGRARFGAPEAYTALNLLFLLLCPLMDGIRYCFPLIPLLAYYAFSGWGLLSARFRQPAIAAALLPALLALSYAGVYSKVQYGALPGGATGPEARELFAFISSATAPGDAVVFRKPRSLAFFTGRRSSMYHFVSEDAELLGYFRKIGAVCLISGPFAEDKLYLEPFIARNAAGLRPVFSNKDFRVYRLSSSLTSK